jgi:hypothetical protein
MSMNAPSANRLKGIFKRGKKFWRRYSYKGRRYRVPLDTEDEGEAVTKALRTRAHPLLAAEPLAEELEKRPDEPFFCRAACPALRQSSGPALLRKCARDVIE